MLKVILERHINPSRYYVDDMNGDDSNNGHSPALAWQTIAKVNSYAFNPGDKIYFKRGETFAEKLSPSTSGVDGNAIVYGAYGTGARPMIDGSAACAFETGATHHHMRFEHIDFNGASAVKVSTVICWTHDMYFYDCVFRGAQNATWGAGIYCNDSDPTGVNLYNITIDSCEAYDNNFAGICITSDNGVSGPHDCLIKDSIVHDNGVRDWSDHGIYVNYGVTIDNCTCYDNHWSGIKLNCEGNHASSLAPIVKNCTIYGNYIGITADNINSIIYNNKLYGNNSEIILDSDSEGCQFYFNTLVNSLGGTLIRGDPTTIGTIWKNNVFVLDAAVNNSLIIELKLGNSIDDFAAANTFDYNIYYHDGLNWSDIFYDTVGRSWLDWIGYGAEAHGTLLTSLPGFVTRYTDLRPIENGNFAGLGLAIVGYEYDRNGVERTDPPTPGCYDELQPETVFYLSSEIGLVGDDIVVVIFTANILASNYATGVTIKANSISQTISNAVRQADHSIVYFTLSAPLSHGDTITWEYDADVGDYSNLNETYYLADVTPQAVTDNIGATIGSFDFNGTTDRIDWSAISDLTASPLTIMAWIGSDGQVGSADYMLCMHQSGDAAIGIIFSLVGVSEFQLYRQGSTFLSRYGAKSGYSFPSPGFCHLLATHDGTFNDYTKIKLYINGVEIDSYNGGQNGATETAPTGSWSVGGRIYDDARNFDGKLCQIAAWNVVLDQATITALAAGDSPAKYPTNLVFYWKGNTNDLHDEITSTLGVADGTTYIPDVGPTISYP